MSYLLVQISVFLGIAAIIGFVTGWVMRGTGAHSDRTMLQRQLVDIKSRIPHLETTVRNREQQLARLKDEMDVTAAKLGPLSIALQERDRWVGDRDRTISLLRSELALLKQSALPDADDDGDDAKDEALRELKDALVDRDRKIADFTRRLSEAVSRPIVTGISPEIERRLKDANETVQVRERRIAELDRERERQDKWLAVLTEQLETSRDTNRRLNEEAREARVGRERIRDLEGQVAKLCSELSDRDRRLAASRFELSTARAMMADLETRLKAG